MGLAKDEPVFQLEDERGLVTKGTKLRLKYDKKMKVSVKASSSQIGHYRVPVIVGFYHEMHSDQKRDMIRFIFALVIVLAIHATVAFAAPTAPGAHAAWPLPHAGWPLPYAGWPLSICWVASTLCWP